MNDDNIFAAGDDHGSTRSTNAEPFEWTDRMLSDVFGLLNRGWELVVANLGTVGIGIVILFGIGILGQMVNFAISIGTTVIQDELTRMIVQMVGQQGVAFLFFLAQLYIQLGLMKAVIELDRGNEVELDVIWSQGGAWIQAIGVTLALGLAYVVVFGGVGAVLGGIGYGLVAAMAETGLMIALVLGSLVFFVVFVAIAVIGLGLQMIFQSLVDQRAEWLGAIAFSWALTDGWKLFLFVQGLVLAVLYIGVACFTCFMGLPVAIGVVLCVQAVTYNAILSDADASGRLSA